MVAQLVIGMRKGYKGIARVLTGASAKASGNSGANKKVDNHNYRPFYVTR